MSGGCFLQPVSQCWAKSSVCMSVTPYRGDFDPNSICLQGYKKKKKKKEKNSADVYIAEQGGTSSSTAESNSICLESGN